MRGDLNFTFKEDIMAYYYDEPSHTFGEYLLIPGYTSADCIPEHVSLRTPVTRFNKKAGEESDLYMNIPMVSAVMQSVSDDRMAVALAQEGGISFIYGSQTIEAQAAMVARAKSYKAGFVTSDSNIRPDQTLEEVIQLIQKTGHSTIAVTADGTRDGYELNLTRMISEAVNVPVIASGGGGKPEHLTKVLTEGKADAALIASMVHSGQYTVGSIKEALDKDGVPVRFTD